MASNSSTDSPDAAQTYSIMSRPRPATRRFLLDRPDLELLCGARSASRLRLKIPQKIIEAENKKAQTKDKDKDQDKNS